MSAADERGELRARLDRLDELVGRPGGREMARLAALSGAKLAASTLSDIRTGKRVPRADSLHAFVTACLSKADELNVVVPAPLHDHDGWERLREAAARSTLSSSTSEAQPVGWVRRLPADTGVFVGREDDLAALGAATGESDRVVVVAVHGLGGVGKSALAARFAHLHHDRFSPVWWVTADSVTAIDTALADLATAQNPALAELPAEQRTERAIAWLASHTGWLLVLDNLTAPADAQPLLARVQTGTVLITSRHRGGWRTITTLSLDVLAPDEAVDLLAQTVRGDWPEADLDGADRLCAELGWLPLAIEQAGAYIAQTRITPVSYLGLLDKFPVRMFAATAEGGDAQRTMARVWHVTLDKLSDTPLAGEMLRRLAWYAPDRIPRALADDTGDPALTEALGRLAAYSMITLDVDTISVHRLVQAVSRTPDPADPHRRPEDIADARDAAAATLAGALAQTEPELPAHWPVLQTILPHARALLDHTDPATDTEPHCLIADEFGSYLRDQGDTTTAIAWATRASHSHARIHGADHPDTLTYRDHLARAYQSVGDLGRAIPLFESTLADRERVLVSGHPRTLGSRSNLAAAYQAAGRVDRAIPLFESVAHDLGRLPGLLPRDTLGGRNNLAMAYKAAGKPRRAIALLEPASAESRREMGLRHPLTLLIRSNLADAYEVAGDPRRALELYESVVTDHEQELGIDHPRTLHARNSLACTMGSAGDLRGAISLFEVLMADYDRVLGPLHPDTLSTRNNLGTLYKVAGKLDRAIPLLERTAADRAKVLGPERPETLLTRSALADTYASAGDLDRAIPLLEATVAVQDRILGSDNPETLYSRNLLAITYQEAKHMNRAMPLYVATLRDREKVLGSDHPDTLISRSNLAHAHHAAGDLTRAMQLYTTLVADQDRLLGPENPQTMTSRSNLGGVYLSAEKPRQAISMFKAVLATRMRVLEAGHPDIFVSRINLAFAYKEAGNLNRAITMIKATLADAEETLGRDHPLTQEIRSTLDPETGSRD